MYMVDLFGGGDGENSREKALEMKGAGFVAVIRENKYWTRLV